MQINIGIPHLNSQTHFHYLVVEWKACWSQWGFSTLGEGPSTSAQENECWVATWTQQCQKDAKSLLHQGSIGTVNLGPVLENGQRVWIGILKVKVEIRLRCLDSGTLHFIHPTHTLGCATSHLSTLKVHSQSLVFSESQHSHSSAYIMYFWGFWALCAKLPQRFCLNSECSLPSPQQLSLFSM